MLSDLLIATGVSAFETEAANVFRNYAAKIADEVQCDHWGNTVAVCNRDGKYHVMLSAHIDEVGFQVVSVTDKGLLKIRDIGGVNPARLNTQKVVVCTASGYVEGVLVSPPQNAEGKQPEIADFFIDIDASCREDALGKVAIGDSVAFKPGCELNNGVITSKSIDDRAGCYVLLEAMKRLKGQLNSVRLSAAATVQEEIGLRGMAAVAGKYKPDYCINIDVTDACQMDKTDRAEVGKGCVIHLNADSHAVFRKRVEELAAESNIPLQKDLGRQITGGTDSSRIQIFSPDTIVGEIAIPCKYMHSHTEKCALEDIEACVEMVVRLVKDIDAKGV